MVMAKILNYFPKIEKRFVKLGYSFANLQSTNFKRTITTEKNLIFESR